MTIRTTNRIAGPFTAGETLLPFAFKVFSPGHVLVRRTNASGVVTVLTMMVHYTVLLHADQEYLPGGSVTLLYPAAPGDSFIVTTNTPLLQPVEWAGIGTLHPSVIADALDRLVVQIQELHIKGGDPGPAVAWADVTGKPATFPPDAHTHDAATTTVDGFMSAADKTKLNGIATGATANSTDAQLRARSSHTGTQAISTVTNLQPSLDALKTVPAQAKSAAYTLALADGGQSIDTTANVTIPANSAVAFPVGATIMVTNTSASSITININTDTLRLAGTATTGARTLAGYGMCTLRKVATTTWFAAGAGLT